MLKLYYSPGACSMGVHIVAKEASVDVELVSIPVAEKANLSADYLAINPRGRVPALDIDGQVYTEAPALLVYLASLNPSAGLLPSAGDPDLARCLEWVAWFNSTLHIAYAQVWRPERFLSEGSDSESFSDHGKTLVADLSAEVGKRIRGPWFLGDQYTIADAYALAFYRWGYRIGLAMTALAPSWAVWAELMLSRPAVREVIEAEGIGFEYFYPAKQ